MDFVQGLSADFAKFLRKGYIPYAEALVLYFLHRSRDEGWIEKLQSVHLDNAEIKELIMSTAQRLMQKGRQDGIQEGEQLGIQKGSRQIAREMLRDREPVEKIMRYTGLSKEEIHQLALSRWTCAFWLPAR